MILRKLAYLKIISIEKERSDTSFESHDGKKDFLLTNVELAECRDGMRALPDYSRKQT